MNRTFLIKMIQAKQLEYEALKEIMPDLIKEPLTKLESEIMETAKEYVINVYMNQDGAFDYHNTENRKKKASGEKNGEEKEEQTGEQTRKVNKIKIQ